MPDGVADAIADGIADGIADAISDGIADGIVVGMTFGVADIELVFVVGELGIAVGTPLIVITCVEDNPHKIPRTNNIIKNPAKTPCILYIM
jgi:hypothetical protein